MLAGKDLHRKRQVTMGCAPLTNFTIADCIYNPALGSAWHKKNPLPY